MLYNRAFLKMEAALSKDTLSDVNQNSFKAWLYGRMLFAASSMKDEGRINVTREKLNELLEDENTTKQIKLITQQESVVDALLTGLHRTSDSNAYPAWALAILRLAAITIRDDELFNELEVPLDASIDEAVKGEAKQEVMLAKVNNQLAIVRQSELLSQVLPDEPVNLANCI